MMTYEEVAAELMTLGMQAGEHAYMVKAKHLDTTALHLLPFAWFIAFGPSGKPSKPDATAAPPAGPAPPGPQPPPPTPKPRHSRPPRG